MTITDFIRFIQSLSASERHFLSEVATLTKLMLLEPATNAVCERSFPSLKRLKTYLWPTMGDDRLLHVMVLHVHKQLADSLDLIQAANQFIASNDSKSRYSEHLANVTCQWKTFLCQAAHKRLSKNNMLLLSMKLNAN